MVQIFKIRTITITLEKEKKNKAIELLKQLDIYEPYIEGFKEKDQVCFFERFGGFWVYQEPEIEAKMREIEKKYNCKVYAITHEFTKNGITSSKVTITSTMYSPTFGTKTTTGAAS